LQCASILGFILELWVGLYGVETMNWSMDNNGHGLAIEIEVRLEIIENSIKEIQKVNDEMQSMQNSLMESHK
jgi:hypothetical protein